MNKLLFLLLLLFSACSLKEEAPRLKPNLAVQDKYLKQLPSPFQALSSEELSHEWGKEMRIGLGFARELDLYQAITAFKRAEFLDPPADRLLEISYDILFCYYLGKKYTEAVYIFENSPLKNAPPSFAPYRDLLVILYDCTLQLDQTDKGQRLLNYIQPLYPDISQKLVLITALFHGDLPETLLPQYLERKKSPLLAQTCSALLPGAGYLYLGQYQSAFTAFALNGLFIWAAVNFFQHRQIAAGLISTGFEAGWYFGAITGAAQETNFYNNRIYESLVLPYMNEQKLFPILMLQYGL